MRRFLAFAVIAILWSGLLGARARDKDRAPGTQKRRDERQRQFLREHTDQSNRVRPDLWEEGIRHLKGMTITGGLGPSSPTAVPQAIIGLAGVQWTQIGPAPLRIDANQEKFQGPGPDSGEVVDIAIAPTGSTDQVIYIATNDGGIWKSIDGGTTWKSKTDSMPSLSMGAIALDPANPSIVYAGTGNLFDGGLVFTKGVGIYKSSDAGETWPLILNPGSIFTNKGVNRIVVLPSGALLVATSGGLFRSVDGGASFGKNTPNFNDGQPVLAGFISDLDADTETSTMVYASVWGGGIFRSIDAGATFPTNLFSNPGAPSTPYGFIAFTQSTTPDNRTMYASVQGAASPGFSTKTFKGLFRSTDGGSNWAVLSDAANRAAENKGCQCGYDQTIGVDPQDPDRLYMGFQELYVSINATQAGAAFGTPAISRNKIHWDHHALIFSPRGHWGVPPTRLYVGTDGGIAASGDGASTWTNINEGIATNLFTGIDIGRGSPTNNAYTYGGCQDTGTEEYRPFFHNADWHEGIDGDGGPPVVSRSDPRTVYGLDDDCLMKTTDGGMTWDFPRSANTGLPACPAVPSSSFAVSVAVDPNDDSVVYAASGSEKTQMFQSTDGGASFTLIWTFAAAISGIATAKIDSNTLWVGLKDGTVRDTANALAGPGVTTFTPHTVTGAPTGRAISGLAIDPSTTSEVVVVYPGFCGDLCSSGNRTKHVFRTTDNGANWNDIGGTDGGDPSQNLPDLPLHSVVIDPGTSPHTIVVASNAAVMRTLDLGATWQVLGAGLPIVDCTSLALDSNASPPLLRVGTYGRSVFELTGPGGTCTSPIVIPAQGGTFSGTTVGASLRATGTCGLNSAGQATTQNSPEQVFQWTPADSGPTTLQTCGDTTTFDTVLYMRSGSCVTGAEVACNDDTSGCLISTGDASGSKITRTITAGQTYFIIVDGFDGARGNFNLRVTPPVSPTSTTTSTTTTTQPSTTTSTTTTTTSTTTTTTRPTTTTTTTTTSTTMPSPCLLDVDGNGRVEVSTDIVYIARHLLGLTPVPPSFRVLDPTIPPDAVIAANIDTARPQLDVDTNSRVEVSTDIVYIARHLLRLTPVPPSFRVLDPTIPPDAVIATHIDALCP